MEGTMHGTNGTAARPEIPIPGHTVISYGDHVDLQRRAEDGDLIRRAEKAWRVINGTDLRHELHILAATYEEMKRTMIRMTIRPPADAPDRQPPADPPPS